MRNLVIAVAVVTAITAGLTESGWARGGGGGGGGRGAVGAASAAAAV
jgi:hypothetical protein